MARMMTLALVTTLGAVLAAAPALAQMQPSPSRPGPPASAPAEKKILEVEGKVSQVDHAKKTLKISSGFLGLGGATMSLTDETKVQVNGKDASIAEIRQGTKVKATYESQNGQNIAKSIEVKPEEAPAASPATRPGAATPGVPGPKN